MVLMDFDHDISLILECITNMFGVYFRAFTGPREFWKYFRDSGAVWMIKRSEDENIRLEL